ncbi:MAG: class I SAM-dependent methyltransferase [Clostridia bacterium]|nr:class I SAM-dependent methyltransferase [Clostridia bacterium]
MWLSDKWTDYECIDTSEGEKLERWGKALLRRPDPQVFWKSNGRTDLWQKADAHYHRSKSGGGSWEFFTKLPERWIVSYGDLRFYVKPLGFKHTGLFPEQAVNWDRMRALLRGREARVLNLFAYTGGASCACAAEAAEVVHVDAAKGMVAWAKENAALSNLADKRIRYIVDDCMKFVEREKRRGRRYDAIIMDPPSYGRGPNGEVWKLEDCLYNLIEVCAELLSERAIFFAVNSYTTSLSPTAVGNILKLCLPEGSVEADEIGLPITASGLVLPCGASGIWRSSIR